jgi:hypothetical protein
VQLASALDWQLMSQLKFACAVQLPWHSAWHCVSHVADGGVPSQLPWQRALHEAWHSDEQFSSEESDEHWLEHWPLQSESHEPWQLNDPGFAVHCVLQFPSHVVVQSAVTLPVHWPEQLASTESSQLTGVHWAVQPPEVSNVHDSLPEKSMLPHEAIGFAFAVPGVKSARAPSDDAAIKAKSEVRVAMEECLLAGLSHHRGARVEPAACSPA